jgi:two-component system nitrogen regulation response regulator NtrX
MVPLKRVGHILLVDGRASVREAYRHYLARAGFKVVGVRTAEEAIRLLEAGDRPAVILTDDDLPGAAGVDLLRRVRSNWHFIPVIVYAESMNGTMRSKLIGQGAVAGMRKPVDLPGLLAFLRQLTGMTDIVETA